MALRGFETGIHCLKLDRGQPAKTMLPAFEVVWSLDPGHRYQAQFLAYRPWLAVKHVLLQQRESDSIAALSAHAPTRPIDPVRPLILRVNLRTKLLERSGNRSPSPPPFPVGILATLRCTERP